MRGHSSTFIMNWQKWASPVSGETWPLGVQTLWNSATRAPFRLSKPTPASSSASPTLCLPPQKKLGRGAFWTGDKERPHPEMQHIPTERQVPGSGETRVSRTGTLRGTSSEKGSRQVNMGSCVGRWECWWPSWVLQDDWRWGGVGWQ